MNLEIMPVETPRRCLAFTVGCGTLLNFTEFMEVARIRPSRAIMVTVSPVKYFVVKIDSCK